MQKLFTLKKYNIKNIKYIITIININIIYY